MQQLRRSAFAGWRNMKLSASQKWTLGDSPGIEPRSPRWVSISERSAVLTKLLAEIPSGTRTTHRL
jgi:hypothetical protein